MPLVQILQVKYVQGSTFSGRWSKLCKQTPYFAVNKKFRGDIIYQKISSSGTNFGGSIFTMTSTLQVKDSYKPTWHLQLFMTHYPYTGHSTHQCEARSVLPQYKLFQIKMTCSSKHLPVSNSKSLNSLHSWRMLYVVSAVLVAHAAHL